MSVAPGGGGFGNIGSDLSGASNVFGAAGSLIGGITTAAGDQDAASSYQQEAQLYGQAAQVAGQDITLAEVSGQNQLAQLQLGIEKTEATATATEGTGNVRGPTTADILANSQQQAALAVGQQRLQTQLEASNFQLMQTGYEAQQAGAEGEASAAKIAASGGILGGIFGALGGIAKAAIPFL